VPTGLFFVESLSFPLGVEVAPLLPGNEKTGSRSAPAGLCFGDGDSEGEETCSLRVFMLMRLLPVFDLESVSVWTILVTSC